MSYLKEHDDHVKADAGYITSSIIYVGSFLGEVECEVCDKCGYISVFCTHKHCTWNKDETQLICNLCESDGT